MTVGFVAVNLGIWVAGVGWPYYLLFALEVTVILGFASLQKPQQVSKASPHQDLATCRSLHHCVWYFVIGATCFFCTLHLYQSGVHS